MQSRRVAAANDVCAAVQRMSQPNSMVTTNSTVLDSLAVLPVGSTVSKEIGSEQIPKSTIAALGKLPGSEGNHGSTVCLDNLTNAQPRGACNMAGSLAACFHSVSFEMPCVHPVVPLLDVDEAVEL